MESKFDLVTIASAVVVAGYVAIILGCVALYDFGLSPEVVRSTAMLATSRRKIDVSRIEVNGLPQNKTRRGERRAWVG
jgi:hypothetical protein